LTVEQVRELGLPSTPLKATEKRAWRDKHNIDQTEIDALATLQPDTFRQIVHRSVSPYFDATLTDRVERARWTWVGDANRILNAALAGSGFDVARDEAEEEIGELVTQLTDEIEEREAALDSMVKEICPDFHEVSTGWIENGKREHLLELPPVEVPQPELAEPPEPFVSSDMPLEDAIAVLKDRKDYSS
jgi:hypothetical protein